jgi:hypothetical protein
MHSSYPCNLGSWELYHERPQRDFDYERTDPTACNCRILQVQSIDPDQDTESPALVCLGWVSPASQHPIENTTLALGSQHVNIYIYISVYIYTYTSYTWNACTVKHQLSTRSCPQHCSNFLPSCQHYHAWSISDISCNVPTPAWFISVGGCRNDLLFMVCLTSCSSRSIFCEVSISVLAVGRRGNQQKHEPNIDPHLGCLNHWISLNHIESYMDSIQIPNVWWLNHVKSPDHPDRSLCNEKNKHHNYLVWMASKKSVRKSARRSRMQSLAELPGGLGQTSYIPTTRER